MYTHVMLKMPPIGSIGHRMPPFFNYFFTKEIIMVPFFRLLTCLTKNVPRMPNDMWPDLMIFLFDAAYVSSFISLITDVRTELTVAYIWIVCSTNIKKLFIFKIIFLDTGLQTILYFKWDLTLYCWMLV